MFRRLYRQRRRFLLFWSLVALTCLLMAKTSQEVRVWIKHDMAGPEWLAYLSLGLSVFILSTTLAILVILLAPALRRAIEVGALTTLVVEAQKAYGPSVLSDWGLQSYGFVWFIGLFYVIELALAKDVLRQRGLRFDLSVSRTRTIDAAPEAVWAALVPDEHTLERHWVHSIIRITDRPDLGPNAVEAHYRLGRYGTLVQRHRRRVWQKPFHAAYDFGPDDEAKTGPNAFYGTFEMRLEPLADGRSKVTLSHHHRGLGIGTWLLLVLDDFLASELDGAEAFLKGRRDWSVSGWQVRKMARA